MICISAGHHVEKKGASYKGFYEYDEALVWVDLILAHLGTSGLRVPPGYLRSKVQFINDQDATIAVEVHFNSAVDSKGNRVGKGCETLYFPGSEKGKKLAEVAQASLTTYFQPDRGVKEGWYRMDESKGPDFFLANTKCPSIILEPEFIHRKETIQEFRADACKKLAEALLMYVNHD